MDLRHYLHQNIPFELVIKMPKESHAIKFRKLVEDLSIRHRLYEQNTGMEPSSRRHNSKKRNYVDSFGDCDYELERYGQNIDTDYFAHNYGHGAHTETETK